jgi:hypothetical protein
VRHSASASATVVVIGLSQITWMPCSMNAIATSWWRWLGVTIVTASMRSSAGRAPSFAAIAA